MGSVSGVRRWINRKPSHWIRQEGSVMSKSIIVCMRVEKDEVPMPDSSKKECFSCSRPVYVAKTSPKELTPVCFECMIALAKESGEFKIMPLLEKQRDELKAVLGITDQRIDKVLELAKLDLLKK